MAPIGPKSKSTTNRHLTTKMDLVAKQKQELTKQEKDLARKKRKLNQTETELKIKMLKQQNHQLRKEVEKLRQTDKTDVKTSQWKFSKEFSKC